MEIIFFKYTTKSCEFSNYYQAPILIDGDTYLTVEHYLQASKFPKEYAKYILELNTPEEAVQAGKTIAYKINSDWNEENALRKALMVKFTNYPKLKELLLSTQNKKIITTSSLLGKILEEIRGSL